MQVLPEEGTQEGGVQNDEGRSRCRQMRQEWEANRCQLTHGDRRAAAFLASVWNLHVQARRSVEPLSRNDDAYPWRKRTPRVSSNKCVGSSILEKQERWKIVDHFDHFSGDLSNAELLFRTIPSTSSVSTEQSCVESWLSKSPIMHFSSTGKLEAHMNEQLDCSLSLEVVSVTATFLHRET